MKAGRRAVQSFTTIKYKNSKLICLEQTKEFLQTFYALDNLFICEFHHISFLLS